jgi:hypothetical protein
MRLVKVTELWLDPDEVVMVIPKVNYNGDPSSEGCMVFFKNAQNASTTVNGVTADQFVRLLTEATAEQH